MKVEIKYHLEKKEVEENCLPYFFEEGYKCLFEKREIVYYFEPGRKIYGIARVFRIRFLKCLQFIYPPVCNGSIVSFSDEQEFTDCIINTIKSDSTIDRIIQSPNFCIFRYVPAGSTFAPFGSYVLKIRDRTKEELFQGLHQKHRNAVRSAERNGAAVEFGLHLVEEFHELYVATMRRNNQHIQPIEFFRKVIEEIPANCLCGIVFSNSKPVGAAFIFYNHYGAFYDYGASAETTEIPGAVNLLHWRIIEYLQDHKVNSYDFVGARINPAVNSKYEGLQRFKERFGSELREGFLWKMDISPFKCQLFDSALDIKNKLSGKKTLTDLIEQEKIRQRQRDK